MPSQCMDNEEVWVRIPVSGIPKGYKVVGIRPANPGDTVLHPNIGAGFYVVPSEWINQSSFVILEKLYDPGIAIPNGWKVWKDNSGEWRASDMGNSVWKISGLQHFSDFVPPPNRLSAIVERQV